MKHFTDFILRNLGVFAFVAIMNNMGYELFDSLQTFTTFLAWALLNAIGTHFQVEQEIEKRKNKL